MDMDSPHVGDRPGAGLPRTGTCRVAPCSVYPCSFFFSSSLTAAGFALPLARLHHLADEEAEDLLLAAAVLLDLAGVGGDDLVDDLLDGAAVGDLLEALLGDDGVGVLAALPHLLEDGLGDLAGDGAVVDALQHPGEHLRRRPAPR